jgi:oligosaccharide repeat unit polymerase
MNVPMYEFYWLVAGFMAIVSLATFRRLLHPHVVLTCMLLALFTSDFLVRGYAPETVGEIPRSDIEYYQLILLVVLTTIWATTYLIALNYCPVAPLGIREPRAGTRSHTILLILASFILALELVKRLATSGWSLEQAIALSLLAYGQAPWKSAAGPTGNLGDETFILVFVGMVLPVSGMIYGYLWAIEKGAKRWLCAFGFMAVIGLLMLSGTRFPVVLLLFSLGFFIFRRMETKHYRAILVVGSLFVVAAFMTSAMYLYRAHGFQELLEGGTEFELVYHQDDNHFQILSTMHVASSSSERWDPLIFATAIATHPVPRALWPEKPALLQDFWGGYKNEWTTVTFLGELIAMFGVFGGAVAAIVLGNLAMLLLIALAAVLGRPGGAVVYMLGIGYLYLCLRSMLNISQSVYPLLVAYAIIFFAAPLNRKRSTKGPH